MGNEINAVILQALLCGLLGTGFSAGSVIWDIESWNLVKQTGVYFFITASIMMPTAYLLYWMVSYLLVRRIVREINANLYKMVDDAP